MKLDDRSIFTSKFSKICTRCKHLVLDPTANPAICKAFPQGIPQAIWLGQNDHKEPVKGDRGIRFTPRTND